MDHKLISKIANNEDLIVPTLLKPKQYEVIKKLNKNQKLNENEKRYLRGDIRKKLFLIEKLINDNQTQTKLSTFLNAIDSYYITGLEALKHNGYGWFYETKIIEIINTKIEGNIFIEGKTIKLIRVKSIKNCQTIVDRDTHIKYATNEQIFKDTNLTHNSYTKQIWKNMLGRYRKTFVKNLEKYEYLISNIPEVDYSKYGV